MDAATDPRAKPAAALRRRARAAFARWADFFAAARRLYPYARRRKGRLAGAFGLTLACMVIRLLEPWPLKLVFDHVLLEAPLPRVLTPLGELLGGDRLLLLVVLAGAILAIAFASGFFYYHYNVLAAKLGQKVVAELRADLYDHMQRLSFAFHERRRTGDLLIRLTSDVRLLRGAVIKLPLQLAEQVLLVCGMAVIMLLMDWQLALLALILLPILVQLVMRVRLPLRRAVRKQRHQEGDIASYAADALSAIKVVQAFGLEQQAAERFNRANQKSRRQGVKAARLEARLKWSSDVAVGVVTAAIVGLAAYRIVSGFLSPGDLIVFVAYLRAFTRPLRRVSRTAEQVARTTAAAERILNLLETRRDVRDRRDAVPAGRLRGEVRFEGVAFRHRNGPLVLQDIDLEIEAGNKVAVVGPTGAGKSTLVSLVPRFYDVAEGRVCVDGRDVRGYTLASLRSQVSLVFQEPVLFPTTIAENIAAGRHGAELEQVMAAARRVGIDRVIRGLPDGYDTVLGERGGTLSGGERQCVAIARALLRDAPIVILDEPTTGLDAEAASLVTAALDRLVEGRTVLMISHDLWRLRGCDRVVVVEDGRLVQQGSWDELAATPGLFQRLEAFGGMR